MSDETRKIESIKFAQESAKQIITLATAIVTFTFGAVSVGALDLHGRAVWFISAVLLFLVVSILSGIFTLFALSGILASDSAFGSVNPLDSPHYSRFGRCQFFTFVIAVVLISVFIILWPQKTENKKIEVTLPNDAVCELDHWALTCKPVK